MKRMFLLCLLGLWFALSASALSVAVPERRTLPGTAVAENLARIEAIYQSAISVLDAHRDAGELSQASYTRKRTILRRAFEDQRFAWTTDRIQQYWTRAYGQRKDFMPGYVYYGMPYIQKGLDGNDVNRRYTAAVAVRQSFYLPDAGGLYRMNHARKRGGLYVGSDCSSFVGMNTFGGSRLGLMRTNQMARSPLYQTLKNYEALMPGDILVRRNDHCFFFLYFTDSQKSSMMVIEQGGGDVALDLRQTVSCAILPVQRFVKKGYIPRRVR